MTRNVAIHFLLLCNALSASACSTDEPSRSVGRGIASEARAQAVDGARDELDALAEAIRLAPEGLHWQAGWRWMSPLPALRGFVGVTSSAEGDLWAVDWGGGVLHWDGKRLQLFDTDMSSVEAIDAAGPDDVWIAGNADLLHWNGQRFEEVHLPTPSITNSVWAAGGGVAYATTNGHALYRVEDGRGEYVPRVYADMVTGHGDHVWAVGDGTMWHFDGSTWSDQALSAGRFTIALEAFAPDDVWLLSGDDALYHVHHFDGTQWEVVRRLPRSQLTLSTLAGSSAEDVWLVGGQTDTDGTSHSTLLHYDGRTWTEAPQITTALSDLTVTPKGTFVVGNGGTVFGVVPGPELRLKALTERPPALRAVWASSPSDVWAVGDAGTIVHYDGQLVQPVKTGQDVFWRSVWGSGPNDIWIVGDGGAVLHGDGKHWERRDLATTATLRSVFTKSPGEVWIGGEGVFVRGTATGFEKVAAPWMTPNTQVVDLHGAAADDIWAVVDTHLSHWDGRAWSTPDESVSFTTRRVWAVAANDVWTTSFAYSKWFYVYGHWDGVAWTWRSEQDSPAWMFPAYVGTGFSEDDTFGFGQDEVWAVALGSLFRRRGPEPE